MITQITIIGNDHQSIHPVFTRISGALQETATYLNLDLKINHVTTDNIKNSINTLKKSHGIFAAPTPYKDLSGFYRSIRLAREEQIPWLGACGATQHAFVEFAQNVLKLPNARHVENEPNAPLKFVDYLPEKYRVPNDGPLKEFDVHIKSQSRVSKIYSPQLSREPFFANYSLNLNYQTDLETAGLKISGTFEDGHTPNLFELDDHPFFIGALFQPQMQSTPQKPHSLIKYFLEKSSESFGSHSSRQ